jgi:hypothetical protein
VGFQTCFSEELGGNMDIGLFKRAKNRDNDLIGKCMHDCDK